MRNKSLFVLAVAAIMLFIVSCEPLSIPTKVRIRAKPTVQASLGENTYTIAKYFSISEVSKLFGDSDDMYVYDYTGGPDDTQRYLIHMPIQGVNLNFGEYMNTEITQAIDPVSFTIPSVNLSQSFPITIDLSAEVLDSAGTITVPNIPFVETGSGTAIGASLPSVTATLGGFSTATFSAGSLDLTMSLDGATAGLVLTVTQVAIMDGASTVTSTNTPLNVEAGVENTVSVPLTGITLPNSFNVVLTASTQGGTALTPRNIVVTAALNGCEISGATGINLSSTQFAFSEPDINIVDVGSPFISATIESGSISLAIPLDSLPGFTRTTSFNITQPTPPTSPSGLNLSTTNNSGTPIDLAGQSLNREDISVSGSITLSATNASITGLVNGQLTLTTTITGAITEFTEVTIEVPAELSGITQEIPIGDEVTDWVNYIRMTEMSLVLSLKNPLPANSLTVTANSNAFNFGGSATFAAAPNPAAPAVTQQITATWGSYDYNPNTYPEVDFGFSIRPSGYDDTTTPHRITLNNISPGTLTFSGNIAVNTDWSQASINPPSTPITGSFPGGSETIDLSVMQDYLGSNLGFGGINLRMYMAGIPSSNFTMIGSIVANYTGDAGGFYVLGSAGSEESLTMVANPPQFTTGMTEYTETLPAGSLPAEVNISSILNAAPADLTFSYYLTPSGDPVTISNTGSLPPIQLDMVIEIPLALELIDDTETAEIVIDELSKSGNDMFGREPQEIGTDGDMAKLFDSLVSMDLSLDIDNTTGLIAQAYLRQDPVNPGDESWESSRFDLPDGRGTATLSLTKSDIDFMEKTLFAPVMVIELPGNVAIRRTTDTSGYITMNIRVAAVTDVDQTFDLGGK